MNTTDLIIIGGGHNGLVCAAYCAAAGLKVTVLEQRSVVGGAAVTEEFHPGFRNSVAAYTVSLLNPRIIRELELARFGLRIVERRMQNFLPLKGTYLAVGPGRTQESVANFSARDAGRLDAYAARLDKVAEVVRGFLLKTPPNVTANGWRAGLRNISGALGLGRQLARLDMPSRRDVMDFFTKSAGELLDSWFESDPIKAVLGFDGIVGAYASPYAAGTAYVLLHHCFGETNGKRGAWGHAIGGMGAITQAMASCCRERGVDIRLNAGVREVIVENARAAGVVTHNRESFRSAAVVSNLNPRLLFEQMLDPGVLPADFRERIARYRCASGTFRMNVALAELPRFSCLPEPGDHLSAGIIIAPSLAYMERAYFDARASGWSKAPIVEMLIPSTLDAHLAPPGRHVASLFCQHVAPTLDGGRSWDDCKATVADLMIATVEAHAPGFAASVLGRQILSPLDLERTFGLIGGDIMHGTLTLDQMFSSRPVLGHADYRTPVAGLYQCGAGTHPGGGVTGAPGYNAAREIIRDFRRKRF